MFKKVIFLSFSIAFSLSNTYAGPLDELREQTIASQACAIRREKGPKPYTGIKEPSFESLPIIVRTGPSEPAMVDKLKSVFVIPFPQFSDLAELRKILPGDVVWQISQGCKVAPENVKISFVAQHYFKDESNEGELLPSFIFGDDIKKGTPNEKTVRVGLFHPDLKNNDVGNNWDTTWLIRLSHPSGKTTQPHQLDEFHLSVGFQENKKKAKTTSYRNSQERLSIKELPLSTQKETFGFWSLVVSPEDKTAFATFHLLVNDADHATLDEICEKNSMLQLKDLPSHLESKNFGGVAGNTSLKTLTRFFKG